VPQLVNQTCRDKMSETTGADASRRRRGTVRGQLRDSARLSWRAQVLRRDMESRNAEEARNVRRAWCFGEYRQGRRRDIAPAEEEGPRRVARRRQGDGV